MIITYDKNPALSVNGRLQSLAESANLALNEKQTQIESLEKRIRELEEIIESITP